MEQEPVCPVFRGLDPKIGFQVYIYGYAYSSSWDLASSKKIRWKPMGNCRKGTANVETPKSIPELKIHSKSAMNDYPMSSEMGIAEIGKLALLSKRS